MEAGIEPLTHTHEDLSNYFRLQAENCALLGSPFYAALVRHIADDILAGGASASVLEAYPHEPVASNVALRLLGAVHRRVLAGSAPELARHYPSTGGDGDADAAWRSFRTHLIEHAGELRTVLAEQPVQTNEVARTAALLCGFLNVAQETRLPLRCLEVGASAGLNLRWDRFRYQSDDGSWGDPSSPVLLRGCWKDTPPPFSIEAVVAERAGCDLQPIDPGTEEGRLTLLSFAWPDQPARMALLQAAIDVAVRVPAAVDRADAAEWIERKLAKPQPGVATVVYHSIVIQYLQPERRDRFVGTIHAAGARATAEAPLAWLRMEPGGEQTEVLLTMWPGGEQRCVATAGYHGRDVRYRGA